MKKYLLLLVIIALAISACSSQSAQQNTPQGPDNNESPEQMPPTEKPTTPESLLGAWKLTAYGPANAPTPAVEGADAGLTFNEDGTITGTSGCNGLGGDYTVEGDQITFGEFVSTLMACDEPIMAQEEAAHKVMTGTATYQIEGDTLTITKEDMVLVLTRDTQSTQEPASLTGFWKLTSYGTADVIASALEDVEANLTFNEDGTVTGISGCNEFGGSYTVEGNQITFNEIVWTLKLCDESLMGQEEAFQQVLTGTATYQIEGNTLTITNNDRVLMSTR